ncbi:MAG: UDP-N-acetylglucosamine 1-carboxyvinyltransferase [Candidatus Omnitrophota bacterium]|nr:UDP-N-acetylglucosamine 1-carboxyvinyltransferase [Candidatus Omnitrophota bacterium]
MDKLIIEGGARLKGEVNISGSKNASLPIMAAALLSDEPCVIKNVPDLRDMHLMLKILRALGAEAEFDKGKVTICAKKLKSYTAPYNLVSKMRASFCVLGPLVGRLKKARVSLPGGCIIGVRPVDLHLKGLQRLNVAVSVSGGYVNASVKDLKGGSIYLGGEFGSSVLATANVMMAAVLAKGKTLIENAACEPEVADLANFLNKMGAKITGQGSPNIEIEGVRSLGGAEHKVIPDRIEAGTFIMASIITRGSIVIKGAVYQHLSVLIDKLEEAGVTVEKNDGYIYTKSSRNKFKPVNITTLPYPGFPTDMQAQFMSLMSVTPGVSVVTEKIYPDRFMHVAELNRMGAHIQKEGPHAIISGVKALSGAPVMASDLRASAALVLAGLVAKGRTEISRIYHLDRGYELIEAKLQKLGARIWREKE